MILGIHHVQITVAAEHLEAARQFYVNRLGFLQVTDPFGIHGFWLEAGPHQVHIRVEEDIARHKTRSHPAFLVDNLEAIHADLIGSGCLIDPQADFDGYARIHVIDPGGNRIELMQRATPSALDRADVLDPSAKV